MLGLGTRAFLLFSSLFLEPVDNVPNIRPTSFVLIGDSTTATKSGWGNGFCGSTKPAIPSSLLAKTPCFDLAVGGTTSASYVNRGYWKTAVKRIQAEVKKGRRTVVTIQFGHNDRRAGPASLLAQHLTSMVRQLNKLHATPVLVTSLVVRTFDTEGGHKIVSDTLAPYAQATKDVAEKEKVHLIDLHGASLQYCESIGEVSAHKFNPTATDVTHLNGKGMIVFGRMVADLLKEEFGLGKNMLPIKLNPQLSYNISHGIPSY